MGTLLDLAHRLEGVAERQAKRSSEIAVDTAKAVLQQILISTPVDVSTAMSNWQVSIGKPTRLFRPAYNPGAKGSTRGASLSDAMAAGMSALKGKSPGEPIYISNNAPYITELNRGSSRQAPAGFVEQAVLVGRIKARKARGK